MTPTQVKYSWKSTTRTVFQGFVGIAVMWVIIIEAAGIDKNIPIVASTLVFMGGTAKVMSLPQVNAWIEKFIPWLAPEPKAVIKGREEA